MKKFVRLLTAMPAPLALAVALGSPTLAADRLLCGYLRSAAGSL